MCASDCNLCLVELADSTNGGIALRTTLFRYPKVVPSGLRDKVVGDKMVQDPHFSVKLRLTNAGLSSNNNDVTLCNGLHNLRIERCKFFYPSNRKRESGGVSSALL